jgi:hypothetical protein
MIWYDRIKAMAPEPAAPRAHDAGHPTAASAGPRAAGRGGRRPGAGRRPSYTEPLLRKTVALPRSYVEQLERFGSGNLSEGIRLLVEFAYTRDGTPWFRPAPERPPGPPAPERA